MTLVILLFLINGKEEELVQGGVCSYIEEEDTPQTGTYPGYSTRGPGQPVHWGPHAGLSLGGRE